MPGYDMVVTRGDRVHANPAVIRVAALSEARARELAEQRAGGKVVSVIGLAYCPMCNGFAALADKRRAHQVPGCPGKWETPD